MYEEYMNLSMDEVVANCPTDDLINAIVRKTMELIVKEDNILE